MIFNISTPLEKEVQNIKIIDFIIINQCSYLIVSEYSCFMSFYIYGIRYGGRYIQLYLKFISYFCPSFGRDFFSNAN